MRIEREKKEEGKKDACCSKRNFFLPILPFSWLMVGQKMEGGDELKPIKPFPIVRRLVCSSKKFYKRRLFLVFLESGVNAVMKIIGCQPKK